MTRQRGMSRGVQPVTGSIAHRILSALAAADDGVQTDAQLLPILSDANRTKWQISQYVGQLVLWDMAQVLPSGLQITQTGQAYVMDRAALPVLDAELPATVTTSMALPRTVPVFKPLNMAKMLRGKPMRDGMDDYRALPSLIGNTRVDFGLVK